MTMTLRRPPLARPATAPLAAALLAAGLLAAPPATAQTPTELPPAPPQALPAQAAPVPPAPGQVAPVQGAPVQGAPGAVVPGPAAPAAAAGRAARTPAGHSPSLKSAAPVTVNFVNADVDAVTRAMSTMIERPIAIDPRVKGTLTLYSDQPLSVREAYLNYLSALRGLGFAMVEVGGLLKVVPEAEGKLQTGTVSVGEPKLRGDQILTQVFTLRHENPNSLVAVLRPLISANNTINASPGSNSLVITDYADNLQRIAKIIAALDQPAGSAVEVVALQHAVASDLAPIVARLVDGGGAPVQPGLPGAAGALTVLVDTRSNSLILRGGNPAKLAMALSTIDKLDRPPQGVNPAGNIWVVYLKNADAVRLAAVLRAAFAAQAAAAGPGGAGAAAAGAGASPGAPGQATPALGGAAGGATPGTAPVSATAGPSTGGFIQADPATNSLIITAPEPLYRQLRKVIDQLDSRRAQIYIETLIVKVDAEKLADIGIQWQAVGGNSSSGPVYGGGTNYGQPNIATTTTAINQGLTGLAGLAVPPGLNIGYLYKIGEFWNIGALARFLETKTDANVLATPNLVSLDNEEARIIVGQNVPFITGSYTTTASGSNNPFQTIERKDVGLTLRIKPQIGENGTIRLLIYHENSSVVPSSRLSPQGLTTDKSAIETTVVVDDGQIMVLGGLLKDEYGGNVSQVPFLGDLPVVGQLFRFDNRTRTKSNLLVFLRPMVIRNQEEASALTMDRYEQIRALQQGAGQPRQSAIMPINAAPVVPPPPTGPVPGQPALGGPVPAPLYLPPVPASPAPVSAPPQSAQP
jgi:general secretion pathway protein D